MPSLQWKGPAASPAFSAALTKAGWPIDGRARPAAAVVRTASAEVPERPLEGPWLWVPARAPGPGALSAAVDRGAIDVVCAANPAWERRVLECLRELELAPPKPPEVPGFVAESAAAKRLLRELYQAAQTSMPVLLTGETGTGKELAARLLHRWSERHDGPFVPINCAAIPNELMEGELFGYTRGAFSGAVRDYDGLVAAAEGGTVFLDEIDDTPFPLQLKLLRVLEDHVISRLGESTWRKVDFRLLAATNRDLLPLIESGHFGPDVYQRLSTVQVVLPPLRERLEDLPALTAQLLARYEEEDPREGRDRVTEVTPEALEVLAAYRWPGNVRELRNVVFGALVTKRRGHALLVSDLPRRLWARPETTGSQASLVRHEVLDTLLDGGAMNLRAEVEALERAALTAALARAGGNAAEAARLLGQVGRGRARDPGGTVRTMMRRLGVRR